MNTDNLSTPEQILSSAERCVLHVKNRLGFELDYTADTITVLDHYAHNLLVEEFADVSVPPGDPRRSPLVQLMSPILGAYFGEVIRRTFNARWRFTDLEPYKWRIEFDEFFVRFNPAGVAAEAIFQAPVEDWGAEPVTSPALTEHLIERLRVAPPIPENEFYSFHAKIEVLQIAEDYLKERAAKDGPVSCTAADYDRVLGSLLP
jgi:hypothetical protein